ncbi:MAG TPA: HNH endonuclease [bacterium]|nr:HNH endonuclease [bacterium]
MILHKKIYMDHFGFTEADWTRCEVCGKTSVEIHHIKYKSRGGKDEINNLAALCRKCHNDCHNEILSERDMMYTHKRFMVATTGPMEKKL